MTDNIEQLEQELRVAQELLFLVLDHIGEPVVLDIEESKKAIQPDRMISLDLDEEAGQWVVQVVTVPSE